MRCCNGKSILMGRRTSGNKNNNKAAVYGKRRDGKSRGAQLLKAGGVTFPTASEVVVTFLHLLLVDRALWWWVIES